MKVTNITNCKLVFRKLNIGTFRLTIMDFNGWQSFEKLTKVRTVNIDETDSCVIEFVPEIVDFTKYQLSTSKFSTRRPILIENHLETSTAHFLSTIPTATPSSFTKSPGIKILYRSYMKRRRIPKFLVGSPLTTPLAEFVKTWNFFLTFVFLAKKRRKHWTESRTNRIQNKSELFTGRSTNWKRQVQQPRVTENSCWG